MPGSKSTLLDEVDKENKGGGEAKGATGGVATLTGAVGNKGMSELTGAAPLFGSKKKEKEKSGGSTGGTTGTATTGDAPAPVKAPEGITAEEVAEFKKKKTKGMLVLTALAWKKDIANGIALIKAAGDWDRVITSLPEGAKYGEADRALLYKVLDLGNLTVDDAAKLFKKRFKHEMKSTDATSTKAKVDWSMANVKVVWKQLDVLPESDVSKNTVIGMFRASSGGGGMYYGGTGDIDLGEDCDETHMSHTVRHEVGHGVHEKLQGTVDKWLQNDMHVWKGNLDTAGIDKLVANLGGYPAKYTADDGNDYDFDDNAKLWVRHYIGGYTGSQSWDPAAATPVDVEDNPTGRAVWAAMPAAVRNMCDQSTSQWYDNYANFQVGAGGNRYFLNHWYHQWFQIGPVAKGVIDAIGENYTAMSEKEFFANCYAEYFADPAGKKDPTKWGGKLPQAVQDFMKTCVLDRDPYSKFTKGQKKKKTSK